ncbi:MAG: ThiF family adenylyltransferase [Acidobacteriales bacterium]|nr:ThiF family adenylyltransferase [Terriglobales bacterium]
MSQRLVRQQFLGRESDGIFKELHVGIVGLGGGGSHVAQQLAHVGIGRYTLVDNDNIEESNSNRLIGGTNADLQRQTSKCAIAARQIRRLLPDARIRQRRELWQNAAETLTDCDIIVGCLDTFDARLQLEAMCRRSLIPYVDLGMDVVEAGGHYEIFGQVTLSLPEKPCLKCLNVITEDWRALEAAKYGATGSRPQVVWSNGVLASIAVGAIVQLVTPWHGSAPLPLLEYDGNQNTVSPSTMVPYIPPSCPHYATLDNLGDPWFRVKGRK